MVDRIMGGTAGGKLSARGLVDDFSEDVRAGDRAEGPTVSAVVAVVAQDEILVIAAAEKFVLILFVGKSRRAGRQIRFIQTPAIDIDDAFFKINGFARHGDDAFDHQAPILGIPDFHDVGPFRLSVHIGQAADPIISVVQQSRIHAGTGNGDGLDQIVADQIVADATQKKNGDNATHLLKQPDPG